MLGFCSAVGNAALASSGGWAGLMGGTRSLGSMAGVGIVGSFYYFLFFIRIGYYSGKLSDI